MLHLESPKIDSKWILCALGVWPAFRGLSQVSLFCCGRSFRQASSRTRGGRISSGAPTARGYVVIQNHHCRAAAAT